ncbi:MAG TPA: bifunctional adenosylcobinamide kinase/adenosylcobinamide-phosphate guanylyltransferase [Armatimonadetes bacterium]|nr:bifunctional adenosylcobinamide kinase/adenosylcobinamide-phosphate guanylyltransferase [Armatimonadota bacterium]
MGQFTLIIGGARSGKSKFAVELAKGVCGRVAFIATAVVTDDEMRNRIEEHRKMRPSAWMTVEEPLHIAQWLKVHHAEFDAIIVDCITIWLSNWLMEGATDETILAAVDEFIDIATSYRGHLIAVSNEVGMGVVPETPLGRRFRDLAGEANQRIATKATTVYWLCAGMPVRIKPELR